MYNYSNEIEKFRDKKVRLSSDLNDKLLSHRKSNRDRLINRLPDSIPRLTIGMNSFKPQGSMATRTTIQTTFVYDEYDIDDGLVLWKSQLVDEDGEELTHTEVRNLVREALKDKRFKKQPTLCTNCARVYYAETDEERHHVDFPIYRKWVDEDGNTIRELASENGWVRSDPTQVSNWFNDSVAEKNSSSDGHGTQLRHLNQLTKRFCRSRHNWDMPNGMKLMMLVSECQPAYSERIDRAFRGLLENLRTRLKSNKAIRNLAHPDQPQITRGEEDANVVSLYEKVDEALEEIEKLDLPENDNLESALEAWDWVFRSEGFFEDLALDEKASAILTNTAKTSTAGVIGTVGIQNSPHRFFAR